jgi:hypothetical protein
MFDGCFAVVVVVVVAFSRCSGGKLWDHEGMN